MANAKTVTPLSREQAPEIHASAGLTRDEILGCCHELTEMGDLLLHLGRGNGAAHYCHFGYALLHVAHNVETLAERLGEEVRS